jgi:putative hydrolases of HD superfamily
MATVFADSLKGINRDRCLKMALIHDLPEIYAGDTYQLDVTNHDGKHEREQEAITRLCKLLPQNTGAEIMELWSEFEEGKTSVARLVRLLDRLEVIIQHNESDISTWTGKEVEIQYGLAAMHAERFGFLHGFAAEIDEKTKDKMLRAGIQPRKVTVELYRKYYGG